MQVLRGCRGHVSERVLSLSRLAKTMHCAHKHTCSLLRPCVGASALAEASDENRALRTQDRYVRCCSNVLKRALSLRRLTKTMH